MLFVQVITNVLNEKKNIELYRLIGYTREKRNRRDKL